MKIAVENKTKMPMYVAGQMIPPGEIRHFEEHQVPAEFRPALVAETVAEDTSSLSDLLAHPVAVAIAEIGNLTIADLETLAELERKGKNRKTLIAEIEKEISFRADEMYLAELLDKDADTVIAALPEMSDTTLAHLIEVESASDNRDALLQAAAAEQLTRAG